MLVIVLIIVVCCVVAMWHHQAYQETKQILSFLTGERRRDALQRMSGYRKRGIIAAVLTIIFYITLIIMCL